MIPKLRSEAFFEKLKTYTVDIKQGRVFGPTGFEFCNISEISNRVTVSVGKNNTVLRYQVVWWKATGLWPTEVIDHKDDIPHHDWYDNLQMIGYAENTRKAAIAKVKKRLECRSQMMTIPSILEWTPNLKNSRELK